ncbi:vacuolar protein sorting-associated protein 45 homolog [Hibiscus syriacus]|uniref:vacuolar protein sorting-associated protein 45 homolog n=1 Tax=Hibiscus syriacus TaxID=106335 RepID=UPI001923FEE7|nr:vacuolar protein sorting-associated protein 45 homolog [Hibiscus syriacus]
MEKVLHICLQILPSFAYRLFSNFSSRGLRMSTPSTGRLRDVDYPYVGNHFQQGRPQEVVIFIVGGTTYEESRSVAQLNASSSGIRFLLGGTVVLNSKRFLKDLEEAQRSSNKRQCCVSPNIG